MNKDINVSIKMLWNRTSSMIGDSIKTHCQIFTTFDKQEILDYLLKVEKEMDTEFGLSYKNPEYVRCFDSYVEFSPYYTMGNIKKQYTLIRGCPDLELSHGWSSLRDLIEDIDFLENTYKLLLERMNKI